MYTCVIYSVCGGREKVKMARILPITLLVLFLAISVESVADCHKLHFSDPILPIPGLCYGVSPV